jgi:hypothetical protein
MRPGTELWQVNRLPEAGVETESLPGLEAKDIL